MSLINFSIQHGRTLPEAQTAMLGAVTDLQKSLGALVQRVDWSSDRLQTTVSGPGFELRLRVDEQKMHLEGDIPLLGKLLASPAIGKVKQIVEEAFQRRLEKK